MVAYISSLPKSTPLWSIHEGMTVDCFQQSSVPEIVTGEDLQVKIKIYILLLRIIITLTKVKV